MNNAVLDRVPDVPKQDDQASLRDRIDLRVDPELYARVAKQAERFGVGISAYIRQATIARLELDESTAPAESKKKGR